MKRFVLETTVGGAVILALGYFHWQLNRLDQSQEQKQVEISRLEGELVKAQAMLGSRLRRESFQGDTIALLQEKLQRLNREQAALKQEMKEQANRVDDRVEGFTTSLARIEREKEDLAWKIKRLGRLEKGIGSVDKVEGMLRTQEAALKKLRRNLLADKSELSRDLLGPSVKISGPDTVGSATIVYSGRRQNSEKYQTYLFTSFHVVRNIFSDIPGGEEKYIRVYAYCEKGTRQYKADMVDHEETIDMALLKLRTECRFTNVAALASPEEVAEIGVFTRIVAVGCPLGNDPLPTQGSLSHMENRVAGANYWMINAPTYLGNSGGGIFLADSRRLVGVFSKIYTHGTLRPSLVPHLGLCTPVTNIREWLEKGDFKFILE